MGDGRSEVTPRFETQLGEQGRVADVRSFRTRSTAALRALLRFPACALIMGSLVSPTASFSQEYSWQMDLLVSLLFEGDADDATVGIRGAHRLSKRFWLEGRLSHLDVDDLDIWFLDGSSKIYIDLRGRSRWYLATGAGRAFSDLDDIADGPFIFHAGIGTEIGLGERILLQPTDRKRFYVRPEILARWGEDSFDSANGDFSLSFGWRF